MRLGIVRVLHQYVVDMDDLEQVRRAKAFLKNDINQMAVYPDRDADLDKAIGIVEAGSAHFPLNKDDLDNNGDDPGNLQLMLVEDPEDYLTCDGSYARCPGADDLWMDPGDHVVTTEDAIEMERMSLLRDNIAHIEDQYVDSKIHAKSSAEAPKKTQG